MSYSYATPQITRYLEEEYSEDSPTTTDDQARDLKFAMSMGARDSIKGITQMAVQAGIGPEEWRNNLEAKDREEWERLQRIFENKKYGQEAFASFMTSAIVLDPVGWIPIAGWAKKAKTVHDIGKYGALAGAVHSGLSYVPEDRQTITGMLTDTDIPSGKIAGRLENIALGGALGYPLGAAGGGVMNAVAKARGKPLPFKRSSSEIEVTRTAEGKVLGGVDEETGQIKLPFADEGSKKVNIDDLKAGDPEAFKLLAEILGDERKGFKLTNQIQDWWETTVGRKATDVVFNNWGTSIMSATSGLMGMNANTDENSTVEQKLFYAILMAAGGGTATRQLGKIPMAKMPIFQTKAKTLGDFMSRNLVDNYGLKEGYLRDKHQMGVDDRTIGGKFLAIAEKANKLKEDDKKWLYRMVIGELDEIPTDKLKDPTLRAINDEARELITETSQKMVDLGLLDAETFQRNIKKYLHRTFQNNLKPSAKQKKLYKQISLIGDELRPRGILDEITNAKWIKHKEKYLADGWETMKKTKGKRIIRRDYTKKERAEMGEIEDAAFGLAETGRLLSGDVSTADFFRRVAMNAHTGDKSIAMTARQVYTKAGLKGGLKSLPNEIELELADGSMQLWKRMPNSTFTKGEAGSSKFQYGDLGKGGLLFDKTARKWVTKPVADRSGGMFVPEEVYDDLTRMIDVKSNILSKGHASALRLWKKSKTSWNPAVHMNNTMANFVMMDFADVKWHYLTHAMEEMAKGRKSFLYREAERHGVFAVGLKHQELTKYKDTIQEGLSKITGNDDVGSMINYSHTLDKAGVFKSLRKGCKFGYEKTLGLLDDLYQYEDQIFRMATFIDRIAKQKGPLEAALDAKRWFINYDINAPAINWLRNKGVTPFLSYPYRAVPLLAEGLIMKPWKVAKWLAIFEGVNYVGNKIGPGDEELERGVVSGVKQEFAKKVWGINAEWVPNAVIKLPFANKSGDSMYIDIGRMLPGGDVFEQLRGIPTTEQLDKKDVFSNVLQTARGQISLGYVGDFISAFVHKKDPFTLQDIPELGIGEDTQSSLRYFLNKAFIPNAPGVGMMDWSNGIINESYSTQRIKKALRLNKLPPDSYDTATQERQSPMEAFLYTLGVKTKTVNVDKAKLLAIKEFQRLNSNILELRNRLYRSGYLSVEDQEKLVKYEELQLQAGAQIMLYDKKLDAIRSSEEYKQRMEEKTGQTQRDDPQTNEKLLKELMRRQQWFEGGSLSDKHPVPNVNPIPSERVDKNSPVGLSYEAPFNPPTFLSEALKQREAKAKGGSSKREKRRNERDIGIAERDPVQTNSPFRNIADAADIKWRGMTQEANEQARQMEADNLITKDEIDMFANAYKHLYIASEAVRRNPQRTEQIIDLNRALLTGKEWVQHLTVGKEDSKLDMFNNQTGFVLGERLVGHPEDEYKQAMRDIAIESLQRQRDGLEPREGVDIKFK